MAALDFPASPTNGQLFNGNGRQYKWSSAENAWMHWDDFPVGIDSRVDANGTNVWSFNTYDVSWTAVSGLKMTVGSANGAWATFYPRGASNALGFTFDTVSSLGSHASQMIGRPDGTLTWNPDGAGDKTIWHAGNLSFVGRLTSTPTPTAGAGAFTTVSCEVNYQRTGDSMEFDVTITITANGTAAAFITVPMPFTAVKECVAAGRQAAAGGQMVQGIMAATSSNLTVLLFNNTYPGATGERITLSGRAFVN